MLIQGSSLRSSVLLPFPVQMRFQLFNYSLIEEGVVSSTSLKGTDNRSLMAISLFWALCFWFTGTTFTFLLDI